MSDSKEALVVATKRGYYGKLREPGEKFMVPAKAKASWFEPAAKQKAEETEPDTGQKE